MDHFLSGLDSAQNAWYNPRPMPPSHEFAIGNIAKNPSRCSPFLPRVKQRDAKYLSWRNKGSFQLIPIGNSNMGPGIHTASNASESAEYGVPNPNESSNAANSNSAFKPIHESKIKSEVDGETGGENLRSVTPPPSIALTPLNVNKAPHSHKAKSGERWDTKKVCNVCGKVLSRGDKLKNHILTHSNCFPFNCDSCGQGFLRSEGLRVHTRMHTGERPYVCVLCGKAYTRKDKLTRHAIVHTGERPFVCSHCGKSFTRKDKMQRHELIHRVDKPFTCSPCNLEFVRQETLNTHIEKKHPERLPYTILQTSAAFHPNGGVTDSKGSNAKQSQSNGKASVSISPSVSSSSSNPSYTQATSSIATGTAPVMTQSAPLLSGNPLYSGIALPQSSAALGPPLLSGPHLLPSSSVLNGFTGGLAFSNAPSVPGISISNVHASAHS